VFLLAHLVHVPRFLMVLKLRANNGELHGATEAGADGFPSSASASSALRFQLRRRWRGLVFTHSVAGERVAAQSRWNSLGCWLRSCSSSLHGFLPVFFPRTLVSSPHQVKTLSLFAASWIFLCNYCNLVSSRWFS